MLPARGALARSTPRALPGTPRPAQPAPRRRITAAPTPIVALARPARRARACSGAAAANAAPSALAALADATFALPSARPAAGVVADMEAILAERDACGVSCVHGR